MRDEVKTGEVNRLLAEALKAEEMLGERTCLKRIPTPRDFGGIRFRGRNTTGNSPEGATLPPKRALHFKLSCVGSDQRGNSKLD